MCRILKKGSALWLARIVAATLVVGCRVAPGEGSTPLAARAEVRPTPSVRRVAFKANDKDRRAYSAVRNFGGWRWPFHMLIYDEPRDRFFVPGLYSVDRLGNVTIEPAPMTGPSGASLERFDEIQEALGFCRWEQGETICDSGSHAVIAVWYGPRTIVVLSRRFAGPGHAESFDSPGEVSVSALDAETLEFVGGALLEVPELGRSWGVGDAGSTTRMLARFLRDGTVIIDAGLGARGRRGGHRLAHGTGRIGQVRVDSNGAMTVLDRNKWRVTAAELGLRNAAAARKMVRRSGAIAVGNSPNGVYVLEEDYGKGLRHYVALYDRELQLQWRRSVPSPVRDWFVDDSGWIYLAMMSPRVRVAAGEYGSRTFEIIAVTPQGETAWRWVLSPKPPARYWESLTVGTMVAAGDDLCFSMEGDPGAATHDPAPLPELVCLSPRHGEAVK